MDGNVLPPIAFNITALEYTKKEYCITIPLPFGLKFKVMKIKSKHYDPEVILGEFGSSAPGKILK